MSELTSKERTIAEAVYDAMLGFQNPNGWEHHRDSFLPGNVVCDHAGKMKLLHKLAEAVALALTDHAPPLPAVCPNCGAKRDATGECEHEAGCEWFDRYFRSLAEKELTQRDLYKPENVVAFLRSIENESIAGRQYKHAADEILRLRAAHEPLPAHETLVDELIGMVDEAARDKSVTACSAFEEASAKEINAARDRVLAAMCPSPPPGADAEDAAKWRALRDCARITSMGSAGCQPGGESFEGPTAHVTLNFWTHNERETETYPRVWLDTFVAKARATLTKISEQP